MDNGTQSRLTAGRAELAQRISEAVPGDGHVEIRPGLFLNRISAPNFSVHGMMEPSCCVVAEGCKEVTLGDSTYRYDAANYLIASIGMPAFARIIDAAPEKPYLSARFRLDAAVVTSMALDMRLTTHLDVISREVSAVNVGTISADILDATLRLVRAAESEEEYRILGPLIIRELIYYLLTGAEGYRLNHLTRVGGQDHRMVQAVQILSDRYKKTIRIEDIASKLGMSISGFHSHFKTATGMSPLQFQKQLRLQEAQRIMLSEGLDAGQAAYRVGYEDPSHFSRDYKRKFGESPVRDILRLRTIMTDN